MIRHVKGKWVLYTHDGSRVLGTHDTEAEAIKQEQAVEISKHAHRMDGVLRFDTSHIEGPKRMENGWLRVDAGLTRTGVFEYHQDGKTYREYRPPEEVFHKDAMDSFEQVPVTMEHPDCGILDAKTTKFYAKGNASKIRQDGDNLFGTLLLTDEEAISEVEAGKRAVSCGYHVDVDMTPGVTPSGERYDGVQRNIRGNHVAIVSKARAGEIATLRLDSAGGQLITTKTEKKKMKILKLDGLELEIADDVNGKAIELAIKKREDEIATAKLEITKQTARADKAEEELAEVKAQIAPEKIQQAVSARVTLVRTAEQVLPKDHKLNLDSMTDLQIKREVVICKSPASKAKVEKADEAYVQARFDSIVEAIGDDSQENSGLSIVRGSGQRQDVKEDETNDPDSARERMMKENREAHKAGK